MEGYELQAPIGSGSFGRVFKGRRIHTGQFVALKLVPKQGKSADQLRALRAEVRIMRGLDHPHIVQLLDCFETAEHVVIVSELMHAELYTVLLDDKTLPEPVVRLVALQLAHALHYLHGRRVMHRDLKPQNVLVGGTTAITVPRPGGGSAVVHGPRIALADFGLSKRLDPASSLLTSFRGTPLYMSPESFTKAYGTGADIWALGAMAFELAAGMPPYGGESQNLMDLVKVVTDATTQIAWPECMSAGMRSFLEACLERRPEKRATAAQLLQHAWLQEC